MFPFETETAEKRLFNNPTQEEAPVFWPDGNEESYDFVEPVRDEELVNNPNMLTLDVLKEVGGNTEPFFRTKMLQTIDAVEEYSWSRGEMGGLDWGFDSLNKAFEGLNTGVHLIGGQSNIGRVK